MVDPRDILKFTDEVARRFRPQKIILFGSYACANPTSDSDVDLLVVKAYRGASHQAASRIRAQIDRSFPMDLLVYSPAELSRRLTMNESFFVEIIQQGIVLYDASDVRMGQQGRRRLQRRFGDAAIAQPGAV